MKKAYIKAFMCIILSSCALRGAKIDPSKNPHLSPGSEDCTICHTKVPEKGARGKELYFRFGDINKMCFNCHKEIGIHYHPVGVKPPYDMEIPDHLPLDEEGRITCLTCHTPMHN